MTKKKKEALLLAAVRMIDTIPSEAEELVDFMDRVTPDFQTFEFYHGWMLCAMSIAQLVGSNEIPNDDGANIIGSWSLALSSSAARKIVNKSGDSK